MLTRPEYWDSLWGADGTRCSYRILLQVEGVAPPLGAYLETPSGYVYRVEGATSTDVDATLVGHISSFSGKVSFYTTRDTHAPFAFFYIEEISGTVEYTGEDDIEEESLVLDKSVFTASKPIGSTPCFTMECCLRQKEKKCT